MTKKKKNPAPTAQENEVDSLREYAAEAELVELLKTSPGWQIIEENLKQYRQSIGEKIAYLQPYTKEFNEARILYIASDKVLKIVDDYIENRKRAMELLRKLDNPNENITLDVDTQINNA
jgi:hypothetical protein